MSFTPLLYSTTLSEHNIELSIPPELLLEPGNYNFKIVGGGGLFQILPKGAMNSKVALT